MWVPVMPAVSMDAIQGCEMIMERVVTTPIYHSDLVKIKSMQEQKNLKKLADAVRICIEYSQAHGVFT